MHKTQPLADGHLPNDHRILRSTQLSRNGLRRDYMVIIGTTLGHIGVMENKVETSIVGII